MLSLRFGVCGVPNMELQVSDELRQKAKEQGDMGFVAEVGREFMADFILSIIPVPGSGD